MNKKPTVLILSPFFSPNFGGVETHLNDLCDFLRENNYMTYVLTYQPLVSGGKGLPSEKHENIEIRRINWIGFGLFNKFEDYPLIQFFYLTPILLFATIAFFFKKGKEVDAIHAHGLTAAFIAKILTIIFPSIKKRVKIVVSMHAIYSFEKHPSLSFAARFMFGSASTIFPLALRSENDLIGAGIPKSKIKTYAQWVDQKLFRPRDKNKAKERLGLSNKDFLVLFIGRAIEKKGVRALLETAKMLPNQIKFAFIGDGPLGPELWATAHNSSQILMFGKKSQTECVNYYAACDIVAVPSQYEEGFARVVLETMSSGRPVLASNKGCLPEMITRDVGILVEPTAKNLAREIKNLYENPKKLERLTKNTRLYAEKHFSNKNAEVIAKSYQH